MIYVKIRDTNKIPRAFAQGETIEEVIQEAVTIACEYAQGRPDTLPFITEVTYYDNIKTNAGSGSELHGAGES